MKKLIWKELMEQRWIPLAYAALAALIVGLRYAFAASTAAHTHQVGNILKIETCAFDAFYGIIFAGWLSGSRMMSHETDQGALGLLSLLPLSRQHIWIGKVIAGLINTAASILAELASISLLVVVLYGTHPYIKMMLGFLTDHRIMIMVPVILLCSVSVYFISAFVSTVVYKVVPATILSFIVANLWIFIATLLMGAHFTLVATSAKTVIVILLALSIAPHASATYFTYCSGGNLRTRKRFLILGGVGLIWFLLGLGAFNAYGQIMSTPQTAKSAAKP